MEAFTKADALTWSQHHRRVERHFHQLVHGFGVMSVVYKLPFIRRLVFVFEAAFGDEDTHLAQATTDGDRSHNQCLKYCLKSTNETVVDVKLVISV